MRPAAGFGRTSWPGRQCGTISDVVTDFALLGVRGNRAPCVLVADASPIHGGI